MDNIKQLRLRIINGVNSDGALIYSENFDLMNIVDINLLLKVCFKNIIQGFTIETSTFEKGTYQNSEIKNEFNPIVEYINAEDQGSNFSFKGEIFSKMSYHFISESILDVNTDIVLLLNMIVPGDIEATMNYILNMFEVPNDIKKTKVACKF